MEVQAKLVSFLRAAAEGYDGVSGSDQARARANSLRAWALFVDELPSYDDGLGCVERAQASIGSPPRFVPVCDGGIYTTGYGLGDNPPPDPRTWQEFLALEGDDGGPITEAEPG